jgi:hypothetical protein
VAKPNFDRKLTIAVIGGGKCTAQEAALAEAVGRELAKRGVVLVCGGLTGVMEAACRGAAIESGLTVGILPTENGFALKGGIPVVGLSTWTFYKNGEEDKSIIKADDAVDAVEKAIALAKGQKLD